jgi:hypothetical protein
MTSNRDQVLKLCRSDENTTAVEMAFASGDAVGLLLVGIYDTGSDARLGLLLQTEPSLATDIVLDGIDRNDTEDLITKLAYKAIERLGAQLSLSATQATALLKRLEETEDQVPPSEAGAVLKWVSSKHMDEALSFARAHVARASPSDPDSLDMAAVELLGASGDGRDHKALLTYAGRCVEAGHHGPHATILGHLATVSSSDAAELTAQLGHYAPSNHPLGPGVLEAIQKMTLDQVRTLAKAVPSPLAALWFVNHVMPGLFAARAAELAATIDADWWPPQALDWLCTKAPWVPQHEVHLPTALRSARRRGEANRVSQIHQLIVSATRSAPADAGTRSAMPRLGARALLSEALRGDLPPDDPGLRAAVGYLHPPLRIQEYKTAKWKQPSAAERMAHVVAGINIDEAVELTDQLQALSANARSAFLGTIATDIPQAIAASLAEAMRDDPQSLSDIASSATGADAVLALWQRDHHLPYFRALGASSHSATRQIEVEDLVRDYSNDLSAEQRHELLSAIGNTDERYQLLIRIVTDWAQQHPQPDTATLESAIQLASDHLAAGADPDPLITAAAPLVSAPTKTRSSLYRAAAQAQPTPALVEFLVERRTGESKALAPAVAAAATEVTATLVKKANTSDPRESVEAVKLLDLLDAVAALPFARQLCRTALAPLDRIVALQILGEHGKHDSNPESLSELLRSISDGHDADGDPKVRREAKRALRHLEIGDLAAAHERLGELAGMDLDTWSDHDPVVVYGTLGDALREGLDRVSQAEIDENWAYGIDQLDELAKVLLYRALETAGQGLPNVERLVEKAQRRDPKYGSVVGSQALAETWSWVRFFSALNEKRAAHIVQAGSSTPPPRRTQQDFNAARVQFRDGAHPCLDLIVDNTPAGPETQHIGD